MTAGCQVSLRIADVAQTRFQHSFLRLFDNNFGSLENLIMLFIATKVSASLVELSNIDDAASCVTQQHMIFVTNRVFAKTAVDRVQ